MSLLAPGIVVGAGVVATLALLAWALWLERSRSGGRWRRGALALMAICLFLLVARPASERAVAARTAVLLTAGSQPRALESLEAEVERFVLPGGPSGAGQPVADLVLLVRQRPEIERWLVVGTGLDPVQLAVLPGEVEFMAPALPRSGVDRAQWRRRLALGEELEVSGSVQLPALEAARLSLVGPAGVEGVVDLVGSSSFELNATPRQVGRLLYRLDLEGATGSLASEVVDVEVTAPRVPRLLWLEGAPGFESREVKAWLRDLGGALVVRTQLSRGRFRYETLNRETVDEDWPVDVGRLTPDTLAKFDLLVSDGAAWTALAAGERASIQQSVEAGLGLVLIPDLPPFAGSGAPPGGFAIERVADLDRLEVEGRGPGVSPLAPLNLEALQFALGPGQRTLVADSAGRSLTVSVPQGLGQVAATLFAGTYRWKLRGAKDSHRRYWSGLLSSVARPPAVVRANLPAGPVWIDQPLVIERRGEAPQPSTVTGPDGVELLVAWRQDALEPLHWRTTLWPREAGWHRLSAGAQSSSFYVADTRQWISWRERAAAEATELRAVVGPQVPDPSPVLVAQPLPRWPFFALLLAVWALLWADEQWRRTPEDG